MIAATTEQRRERRMGRKREPDTDYYSGRVAARLRELRRAKGWNSEELREQFAAAIKELGLDLTVPAENSLRAYEIGRRGKRGRDAMDLPSDYYPVVAKIYGYATARGWLPER